MSPRRAGGRRPRAGCGPSPRERGNCSPGPGRSGRTVRRRRDAHRGHGRPGRGQRQRELLRGVLPPGAVPPVLHGTGLALLTRRARPGGARHVVRTPNRAAACGLHVVPLAGADRQYVGATNVVTPQPAHGPEAGMAEPLLRAAREQIDQRIAASQVERWLSGTRPVPLDTFPLIGATSVAGLVLATGTYRDGFHCSPVIARRVAETVLEPASADADFAWFRPERLPIETMTVAESVEEAVAHGLDAAYEDGLRLPFWLGDEPVTASLRRRAGQLYAGLPGPSPSPPRSSCPRSPPGRRRPRQFAWLADYLRAARAHHPERHPADARDDERHAGSARVPEHRHRSNGRIALVSLTAPPTPSRTTGGAVCTALLRITPTRGPTCCSGPGTSSRTAPGPSPRRGGPPTTRGRRRPRLPGRGSWLAVHPPGG
ncbi:FAD-dependent oxidoreductase [Streptomyces sp. M19]